MLLSMSKQFFAARLFTHVSLNAVCICALSPSQAISEPLAFHSITKFSFISPAMDGFPVCLFHLAFSVGTGENLNIPELSGLAKVAPHLARKNHACNQLYPVGVSPVSFSTKTQGGVR